jgi:hypothetical protein
MTKFAKGADRKTADTSIVLDDEHDLLGRKCVPFNGRSSRQLTSNRLNVSRR